jgi:insulin gene enhancer protein ISL-1
MRAKHCVFHVDCFRCGYCDHRLVPGEEFALKDDQLFCKNDCEQHHQDTKPVTSCDQSADSAFGRRTTGRATEDDMWNIAGPAGLTTLEPALSLAGLALPQRLANTPPMSTTSPNSDEVVTTMVPAASTSSSSSSSSKKHKKDKAKTTRMRTVLTEKQLMTLRACYAANCRPDALMKEQLVEMTSLTARVIRVWFQNKRCKDKKRQIAMKQMQAAQEKVSMCVV